MDIAALGHAPHLDWLRNRLAARGFVMADAGASMPLVPGADWVGLVTPGLIVDLSHPTLEQARHRAMLTRAVPADYVELAGAWHPLGEQYGFMMIAGGTAEALELARPLLDALAPLPGAWLAAGPAGAAGFVSRYLEQLARLSLLAWPHAGDEPEPITRLDDFFDRQRERADALVALSQAYWDSLHEPAAPDATLMAEFARPLSLQTHYARVLAGVTLFAFGEHGLLREVLERVANTHATPSAS